MASPQKENGHTGLANEIWDVLYKSKFNGTEFKIILFVIRQTYGFQRKEASMSLTYIKDGIDTSKGTVEKYLNVLIENKVIRITKEGNFRSSRCLSFNKNYEEWDQGYLPVSLNRRTVPLQQDTPTTEGVRVPPQQESQSPPTAGLNKESIKKSIKEIIDFWLSKKLVNHRTITPQMEQQINWKLNVGFTKQQLIDSISNYDSIVNDTNYKLEQKWGLDVFFMTHFEKFLTERDPFNFYPKTKPSPSISQSRTSIPKQPEKVSITDEDRNHFEKVREGQRLANERKNTGTT